MTSDRSRAAAVASLLLLGLAGCGGSPGEARPPLVPAGGRVTVRGEPADGARVMFHPLDPGENAAGLFPHATADDSGAFSLSTFEEGDGAPPGRYRVAITWPDSSFVPRTPVEREELLMGGSPPDRLRGRYERPEQSGLELAIDPDGPVPRTLPPFELP